MCRNFCIACGNIDHAVADWCFLFLLLLLLLMLLLERRSMRAATATLLHANGRSGRQAHCRCRRSLHLLKTECLKDRIGWCHRAVGEQPCPHPST